MRGAVGSGLGRGLRASSGGADFSQGSGEEAASSPRAAGFPGLRACGGLPAFSTCSKPTFPQQTRLNPLAAGKASWYSQPRGIFLSDCAFGVYYTWVPVAGLRKSTKCGITTKRQRSPVSLSHGDALGGPRVQGSVPLGVGRSQARNRGSDIWAPPSEILASAAPAALLK